MSSVLITGASKGLGRATAQEFVERGHRVVATARDPQTLDDLDVDQRLALDVTDQASVDAAIQAAGDIDILVSNAGVIFHASVEASPPSEIERLFSANTVGSIRTAQAVLPQMRERGSGRLLFTSSIAGRVVFPGNGAYAASKWALEALVEELAIEVSHFGIHAVLMQPGAISTGALDDVLAYALPDDPYAALFDQRAQATGSMITPAEVATAIVDAAEMDSPPLRIPVGESTVSALKARDAAPFDVPFRAIPLDW